MGFKRPTRTIIVEFDENTDWHGAEVTCRRDVSLARLTRFEGLANGKLTDLCEVLKDFGDEVLVAWNLEDDNGNPVPANGESLVAWPIDFGNALITAWITAAVGVEAPLVEKSVNGKLSVVEQSVTTGA